MSAELSQSVSALLTKLDSSFLPTTVKCFPCPEVFIRKNNYPVYLMAKLQKMLANSYDDVFDEDYIYRRRLIYNELLLNSDGSTLAEIAKDTGNIFRHGLLNAALWAIPSTIIALTTDQIWKGIGQSTELSAIAGDCFIGLTPGLFFAYSNKICSQVALGQKKPLVTFVIVSAQTALTILGSYLLIFGEAGFPECGIKGIGYAMSAAAILNFSGTMIFLRVRKEYKPYKFFIKMLRDSKQLMKQITSTSVPMLVQFVLEELGFLGSTFVAGYLGKDALIAQQIVNQYFLPFSGMVFNVSQVNAVSVSNARGRQEYAVMRRMGNVGLIVNVTFTLGMGALLCAIPAKAIVAPFINENTENYQQIVSMVEKLFYVQAATLTLNGVKDGAAANLRGQLNTCSTMLWSLATIVIFAGAGYLFGIEGGQGLMGFFIAQSLATAVSAAGLFAQWVRQSKPPLPHAVQLTSNPHTFFVDCRRRNNRVPPTDIAAIEHQPQEPTPEQSLLREGRPSRFSWKANCVLL